MDIQTIDQSYQQLQTQAQGVAQAIQAMAAKMQQGADKNPTRGNGCWI
jgi:hypothetical protein